jgi:CubicO group peptidase (beta-lactamase class C family)
VWAGALAVSGATAEPAQAPAPAAAPPPGQAPGGPWLPSSPAGDATDFARRAIPDAMSRFGIPGLSVAVAEGGSVRFQAGFGHADVENGVRANHETVYRLASVSKPITATAVMKLAEEGRLDLDAPVTRYCADFPAKQWPVSSRQLLCHQGGVRHYRPGEPVSTRRAASLLDGLALFRDDPLDFEPGTEARYSTYGYTLLGCAAAAAAGRPFMALLEEEVFSPAGMTATRIDDVRELIPGRAQGYVRDGSGRLMNSALADVTVKVPGAGLCSTAPDVARFGAALLAGRLVSKETLLAMLTPQRTRDGKPTTFGLGLAVGSRGGRPEAWHTGGQQRVSTALYLRPADQVVVVVLANVEGVQGEVLDLARRVADRVTARPIGR